MISASNFCIDLFHLLRDWWVDISIIIYYADVNREVIGFLLVTIPDSSYLKYSRMTHSKSVASW
jgi:hypothetical protein